MMPLGSGLGLRAAPERQPNAQPRRVCGRSRSNRLQLSEMSLMQNGTHSSQIENAGRTDIRRLARLLLADVGHVDLA